MSGFSLKLIAVLTMLIDHIGLAFHSSELNLIVLRYIGRLSFPLFVFLVVEGCVHTRDMKRYMGRLVLFGFVSQIPFAMLVGQPLFAQLNIFFTLAAGVFFVYLYKLALGADEFLPLAFFMMLFVFGFLLAEMYRFDYGGLGILFIQIGYMARTLPAKRKRWWVMGAFVAMLVVFYTPVSVGSLIVFAWASVCVVPIYFYNGLRGNRKPWSKWLFYWFYPVHLVVLVLLRDYL